MRVTSTDTSAVPPAAAQPAYHERPGESASDPIAPRVEGAASSSPFARVLRGLGRDIDDGEGATRSALDSLQRGADLGAGQLIALQAGVYRYSEAIDLASRLVDRATSGVKTVVQGGGQ